jgi:hypothetical protein
MKNTIQRHPPLVPVDGRELLATFLSPDALTERGCKNNYIEDDVCVSKFNLCSPLHGQNMIPRHMFQLKHLNASSRV